MINKFIVSAVAGLALLGSSIAAADCPAFFDPAESVPCTTEMNSDKPAEMVAANVEVKTAADSAQRVAVVESWKKMAQGE